MESGFVDDAKKARLFWWAFLLPEQQ